MNTSPINFEFNTNGVSNTIRVVEIDGEPWFLATDACKALGLSHTTNALRNCTPTTVQDFRIPGTRGRLNKIISEGGLYELIMQSRKPEALDFRKWVTGTVLPAIRKDGGYIMGEEKVATGEMDEDELVLRAKFKAPATKLRFQPRSRAFRIKEIRGYGIKDLPREEQYQRFPHLEYHLQYHHEDHQPCPKVFTHAGQA